MLTPYLFDLSSLPQRRRLFPRLEQSFADCGYLFRQFKENLNNHSVAAIIAIHFAWQPQHQEATAKTMALFIRIIEKKLQGRIEGGYRAKAGEYFLLLAPEGDYNEESFQYDIQKLRQELLRRLTMIDIRGGGKARKAEQITIDGILLVNRVGETADNALFRAFQELFSASGPANCRPAEAEEIERIINNCLLQPVFQPIYSIADGDVLGYEALSRIIDTSTTLGTEELFHKASLSGLAAPLEKLCRKLALLKAGELKVPGLLFLNVCPTILQSSGHERGYTAALLDELGIEKSRIVFELTERTLIDDYDLFSRTIRHYREQGYGIAIDDLGSGYAGLQMLAQLEPDYVKLARSLVSNIHRSTTRQALVESLLSFCSRIGAKVIAEGIEQQEELDYLAAAGITFGQGYLLAPPASHPLKEEHIYRYR